MRILVDICVFDLRNKGNIAMLQSAVGRLRKFWPTASIEVLTVGPLLLKYYLPDCIPVNPYGRSDSLSWSTLQKNFHIIPRALWRLIFIARDRMRQFKKPPVEAELPRELEVEMGQRDANLVFEATKETYTEDALMSRSDSTSMELLNGVDLYVAAGGQYLSDPCKDSAVQTLERMKHATQREIPVVLVGQGMGPFEDQDLLNRTKEVLPKVDLILVREKNFAPPFLESIGVARDRVILTGDDAIEMSYNARSAVEGGDIGIGIRMALSSGVKMDHILKIKPVLDMASAKYQAKFTPIPISDSVYEAMTDEQVILSLLDGQLKNWHEEPYLYPIDIIKQVSKCRIVVTGAYHPAVFALAQGIPAICLAKSPHYSNKLTGLSNIFGEGCEVIMLDDKHFAEKLSDSIDYAWTHAPELRLKLLESARCQVEWGRAGYDSIYGLVGAAKIKS
jgi:polysaccharide pyruvyl transferase WcaK-like protein